MKKSYTVVLFVITLLTFTGAISASADGPVGADCTNPPNLAPYADLQNCDLTQIASPYTIHLEHANLSGAIFDNGTEDEYHGMIMHYANANGASFVNTILLDVEASNATFVGADFRGADLSLSIMRDADFSGANFTNTNVTGIYSPGPDFEGSIFQNTLFTNASLAGADLDNTDLRGADLRNANLYYVPLRNADLRNANLQGARFELANNFQQGAIWGNTICPDGSNSDVDDGDNFTCFSNLIDQPTPTSTATATRTATPTNTPTATPTATPTLSASNTGWVSPGAQVSQTSGDGNGFQISAVEAFSDNAIFAQDINSGSSTSTSCTNTGKDRHAFYSYAISIPGGSTIRGIEVRLDARADSTSGAPKMCVELSWNNGATWTAIKQTGTLATTEGTHLLGSATDTWGRAWTTTELTSTTLRVRVTNVSSSTSRDFYLDWAPVRIYYTP
jgi:uncharacterized protein YjbI with pentapeptide repeats